MQNLPINFRINIGVDVHPGQLSYEDTDAEYWKTDFVDSHMPRNGLYASQAAMIYYPKYPDTLTNARERKEYFNHLLVTLNLFQSHPFVCKAGFPDLFEMTTNCLDIWIFGRSPSINSQVLSSRKFNNDSAKSNESHDVEDSTRRYASAENDSFSAIRASEHQGNFYSFVKRSLVFYVRYFRCYYVNFRIITRNINFT
jgi:hypothetical protein